MIQIFLKKIGYQVRIKMSYNRLDSDVLSAQNKKKKERKSGDLQKSGELQKKKVELQKKNQICG